MIAVTGAAGFIGSNLATRLSAEGKELVLVDHPLPADKLVHWSGLKNFRFFEHLDFLKELRSGRLVLDAVFHLGACSSTTELNWEYLRKNNIEYSQQLWNWCAQAEVPFIYASSAATYGDGSQGFDDTTLPSKLHPLNPYGRSKNDFDIWVFERETHGDKMPPQWAGVKFFNVYGPHEAHKKNMASMAWKAYLQISNGGSVSLFRSNTPSIRDGEQKRDFVFVEDCIDHLLWLWKSPHAGGLYNSGTGHARTFLDLVRSVFTAMGKKEDIRFIEMPPTLSKQYQNFTEAAMGKIHSAGYAKPYTSIENGVAHFMSGLLK